MAQYERRFRGDFSPVLAQLHQGIMQGSSTASCEGGSDWSSGNIRCAVRVYERYSVTGGNRLSLTLTLIGEGDSLFLSAITAGGSQAAFFKINTWGEEAFLDQLRELAEQL